MTATPAFAHKAESLRGGIVAGALHPLSGPDHMLAMVAVGIWGALLGRPLLVVLPVVFPLVMALSGMAAIMGMTLPPVEIGIAFSVIALGGAIALALRPPAWVAIALVAVFAVFHGYAHGHELPSLADPVGYSIGFVTMTGALHLSGIGIGLVDPLRGGRKVIRTIGAAIAACGTWYLWQAVT
jgi:urease accessory protein